MNSTRKFHVFSCLLFLTLLAFSSPSYSQENDLQKAGNLNQQLIKLFKQGHYSEAIPIAEKALAIVEKALGPDHPDVAQGLNDLATLYGSLGDYAKAEPLYQRSLAIDEDGKGALRSCQPFLLGRVCVHG